jgi:hypothetical protein
MHMFVAVLTVGASVGDTPGPLAPVSVVDYRLLLMVVTVGMFTAAASLWPARRLTEPPAHRPSAATTITEGR